MHKLFTQFSLQALFILILALPYLAYLAGLVVMFLSKKKGRFLFTIGLVGVCFGYTIISPLEALLGGLISWMHGALLYAVYCSPLKENFIEKKNRGSQHRLDGQ